MASDLDPVPVPVAVHLQDRPIPKEEETARPEPAVGRPRVPSELRTTRPGLTAFAGTDATDDAPEDFEPDEDPLLAASAMPAQSMPQ